MGCKGRECAFFARAGRGKRVCFSHSVRSSDCFAPAWALCTPAESIRKAYSLPWEASCGRAEFLGSSDCFAPGALCNPAESTRKAYSPPWEAPVGRAEYLGSSDCFAPGWRCAILRNLFKKHTPLPLRRPADAKEYRFPARRPADAAGRSRSLIHADFDRPALRA